MDLKNVGPMLLGFLIFLIVFIFIMWLSNKYQRKLDNIKIEESKKVEILRNQKGRNKLNEDIYILLREYRIISLTVILILIIGAILSIGIRYMTNDNFLIALSIFLFVGLLIVNFILLAQWGWKEMKKVQNIIELEEETQVKILTDKTHKLLPLGIRNRRNKIQFIDDQEST